MTILRTVRDIQLNEGSLMAKGLFNLSKNGKVSVWFDADEKDRLIKLGDAEFWHQSNDIINEANILS